MAQARTLKEKLVVKSSHDRSPAAHSRWSAAWLQLFLVIIFGLGAHFSKNAFAPAEPFLHQLGISPMVYACISATPVLAGVLLPPFWGIACERRQCVTLLLVPSGILLGQALLFLSLCIYDGTRAGSDNLIAKTVMSLGILFLSAFRAGAEVVQHVTLASMLPRCLTRAFVGLVISTHICVVLCNYLVPKAFQYDSPGNDAVGSLAGLLHVQLFLMIPSTTSVLAACMLVSISRHSRNGVGRGRDDEEHITGELVGTSIREDVSQRQFANASVKQKWIGRLLITWAALTVGFLHALATITNGLLVSFNVSAVTAGDVIGFSQTAAFMLLPVIGFSGDFVSHRMLVVLTSFLELGACLTLTGCMLIKHIPAIAWKLSVGSLATAGLVAPVVSLALIPQHLPKVAIAYGVLDTLKSLTQMVFILLFGLLRESGGFLETISVACVPAAVAMAISVLVAVGIKDVGSGSLVSIDCRSSQSQSLLK